MKGLILLNENSLGLHFLCPHFQGPHVEDKVLRAPGMEGGKFIGIKVLGAKDLKNLDGRLAGVSDPFFKARIGAKGSTWEGKGLALGGLRWKSKVQ